MSRSTNNETFQFLVALPTTSAARLDAIVAETGATRLALVRAAIEAFLAERGGAKLSVELPDDLRLDLAALHEAMAGAPIRNMVVIALREYVDSTLKGNEKISARFAERRKELGAKVGPGKIVEFRHTHVS